MSTSTGRTPMVQILPKRKRPVVSHTLDCRWVAGSTDHGKNSNYVVVPASTIPANVGRCRRCGGGR